MKLQQKDFQVLTLLILENGLGVLRCLQNKELETVLTLLILENGLGVAWLGSYAAPTPS